MGKKDISKTMSLKDGVSGTLNKISAGTVRFKKNLQDLQSVGDRTWTSIRTGMGSIVGVAAGAAAAILGITAATQTLSLGTTVARDLESYRITMETVMKDTEKAGKMMQWASQFANITPFDTTEVIDATVKLQAYGINAVNTLESIGDMAAIMNKPLDQAIEAIADAQMGELERLKEFGITKAMIEKRAGEMFRNQVIVNNKGQIVDQQKFNQAIFAIMDERFKGGMEKQSKTFKGLMSTITGTWKTGLAEMMGVSAAGEIRNGSLFAEFKKSAEGMLGVINQLSASGDFQRIGDGLATILRGATSVFSFIYEYWPLIRPVVYGISAALGVYVTGLIAVRTWTMAVAASQMIWNAVMAANPIGLLIIGIAALIGIGYALINNWEQVKLAGMKMWNLLVEAAQWGVNRLIDGVNILIRAYKFAGDSMAYPLIMMWNGIISAAETGVNKLLGLLAPISGVLEYAGITLPQSVNFSGAKTVANKPAWDSSLGINHVNFGGAKFSDAAIMSQVEKANIERAKTGGKQALSMEELTKALQDNTEATANNTGSTDKNTKATKGNTKATKENTDKLRENLSPLDLADSLLGRIERHLYSAT